MTNLSRLPKSLVPVFATLIATLLLLPIVGTLPSLPPSEAQAATPTSGEVRLTGEFRVFWGDGPRGSGIVKYYYEITDDQGISTHVILDDAALAPFGNPLQLEGKRVLLVGDWVTPVALAQAGGARPAVRARSVQLVGGEAPSLQAVVSGSQPYVILPCRFSDSTGVTPRDTTYFTNLMGSSYPQLDHYWREVSYDNINLTGAVIKDWVNLPSPRSTYIYDNNGDMVDDADLTLLVNDCTAAHDASVSFPSFTGIALMFNQDLDCCAWGGKRS